VGKPAIFEIDFVANPRPNLSIKELVECLAVQRFLDMSFRTEREILRSSQRSGRPSFLPEPVEGIEMTKWQ
jgi:hypothetical protein